MNGLLTKLFEQVHCEVQTGPEEWGVWLEGVRHHRNEA